MLRDAATVEEECFMDLGAGGWGIMCRGVYGREVIPLCISHEADLMNHLPPFTNLLLPHKYYLTSQQMSDLNYTRMAKGSTKTLYGRKTPAEVRAAIQDICHSENYDPFKELIRLATETVETEIDGRMLKIPVATVDQKIAIAKEIASYIAPKIKNIEVKGEIDGEFVFRVENISGTQLPELSDGREKNRQGVKMIGIIPSEKTQNQKALDTLEDLAEAEVIE